jgi:all-trans-retinol 13,14-reductase
MLVRKLTDGIEAQGGKILCQSEVEELETENGIVTAARCKNGEHYEARHFISNAHPAVTCQLTKLKPLYRRRISEQPNTFGMFTVSLLLKPHTLRYFNHNHYVFRKPNVWTFYKENGPVGGVMVCCRTPENPTDDYTRQVDILTPMLWQQCEKWAGTTIGKRGDDYKQMKARMAQECIALTERVLPGLSGMVEACYTSTPLTYRDYTLTPQGSAYGIRKDYHYPMFTIISPRTPLSNLLLTGQSLMLHGVHGVTMTSLYTCCELLGTDYIQTHYNENINMFRYV